MIELILSIYFSILVMSLLFRAVNVSEKDGDKDDYAEMVFMAFIWPIVILLYLWKGAKLFIKRHLLK